MSVSQRYAPDLNSRTNKNLKLRLKHVLSLFVWIWVIGQVLGYVFHSPGSYKPKPNPIQPAILHRTSV